MKEIKKKGDGILQKIKKSDIFPFVCLFFLFLAVHLLMTTNFHDDAKFSLIPQNEIINKLKWNYHNWSTRLIIEFVYYNLYHFPIIIWKVLDSFIMTLIGYSISELLITQNKRENNYIISLLMLMYPLMHMMTAGWISTSANYTWAAALGLYALIPLRLYYDNKKIKWWQYITFTMAALYAGNAEQMVCVMIGASAVMLVYFIMMKKVRVYHIIQLVLLLGLFTFKITGPSNQNVNLSISKEYFRDWPAYNLIDKIYLGINTISDHFIMNANVVFFVFTGVLAAAVIYKYQDKLYRALALFPFLATCFLGMFKENLTDIFPGISDAGKLQINLANFNRAAAYIPLLIHLLVWSCIFVSIYIFFGNQLKTVVVMMIFVLGVGARMIMSISPSIYASGTRTFAVTYFLFIAAAAVMIDEFRREADHNRDKVVSGIRIYQAGKVVLFVLAVMSYLNLLLSL